MTATPPPSEPTTGEIGRETCQDCGRVQWFVWHAANTLWERIADARTVLCPECFDRRSARLGIILVWTPTLHPSEPGQHPRVVDVQNALLRREVGLLNETIQEQVAALASQEARHRQEMEEAKRSRDEWMRFCGAAEQREREAGERLTFIALRETSALRCAESFPTCAEWTAADWGNALAGEVGEACNKIKKLRRGEAIQTDDIADELADVVIYADLAAWFLGQSLEAAVVRKFNEVSARVGSDLTLAAIRSAPSPVSACCITNDWCTVHSTYCRDCCKLGWQM